jgi:tetratricopeptide (TPR) repeat protein
MTMPHQRIRWLAGLTVATGLALCGPVVVAKEAAKPIEITSFSGAYLAARVAEGDNDLDSAITYYKQALAFAPDDVQLQQSLMLTLISQGRFDESLPYADKLKEVPDIERFSRLALAVDTFRKKDYQKAEYWLKLSLQADLDRLISGVMTGWARLGAGHGKDAVSYVAKLRGPEWFDLFKEPRPRHGCATPRPMPASSHAKARRTRRWPSSTSRRNSSPAAPRSKPCVKASARARKSPPWSPALPMGLPKFWSIWPLP